MHFCSEPCLCAYLVFQVEKVGQSPPKCIKTSSAATGHNREPVQITGETGHTLDIFRCTRTILELARLPHASVDMIKRYVEKIACAVLLVLSEWFGS